MTSFNTSDVIDHAIADLVDLINDATNSSVPKKKPFRFRYPFSDMLKLLTRERNYYRNLFKRSCDSRYKSLMNQLNRLIRDETSILSRKKFEARLADLHADNNSLWQFIKSLKNKKHIIPPLKNVANNSLAFSEDDKAKALAENFRKSHLITANLNSRQEIKVKRTIKKMRKNIIRTSETRSPTAGDSGSTTNTLNVISIVSENKVASLLKTLKDRKASGPDAISNRVLKNLSTNSVKLLT